MRRIAIAAGVFVASLAFGVPAALATFHLEKVNEVLLRSSGGDAGVQFVELLDRGGSEEQFTPVFAPYKLVIYDAAANKLGEQTLNPSGLRAGASAGTEYLISTAAADAALGVTGDERLTTSLPPTAGQACFEANPNPPAFSCMTWGTISKAVATNSQGSGSVHGPVPPDGESDQRQPDDSVVAAAPTPKAPNRAASSGAPKPPTTPTPPAAFAGASVTRRVITVKGAHALLPVSCPTGTGECLVRLTLTAASGHGARLGTARSQLAAGSTRTVSVKLTAAARTRLAHGGHLKARAVVKARDDAGDTKTTSASILLVGR